MAPVDDKPTPPNRLRQLRAFCVAAQTGNISRAADRLYSSQPAVSQIIKSLEADLGVLLFERRGPRIQLTDDGRAFLEIALPLLEDLDNLPALFAERLGEITAGSLDIAAGESTILYLLPKYVYQFNSEYPQVNLRLHNVTGRDGLAMLRNGEVDLAVGSMIDIPHDITYVPTFSYDPMLITALEHPLAGRKEVTLEEVSECGLILPPRHLSTWHIVDLVFRQHGLNYKVVLEAGGWEIIKRYVALGMGVSIVTSICLTGEEALAAIPLTQYFPRRSYGIVLRHNKHLSPQARRFVQILDPAYFDRPDSGISGQPGPSHHGKRPSRDGLVGHDEALT
jgi:DNA-binding transcriptional LysR family regulator